MAERTFEDPVGVAGGASDLTRRPELAELIADRRRFFRGAWSALGVGYAGFLVLPAVAPDVFAARVGSSLSVGILLGVAYTVLVFALASAYGRRARRWDALTDRLASTAGRGERDDHAG